MTAPCPLLHQIWDSPVGRLRLTVEDSALTHIDWIGDGEVITGNHPVLDRAVAALEAFFAGREPNLDFPMAPAGSDFQKAVWREMLKIPFGETRTYGDLAEKTGAVAQAVGGACGANPIPILVPCHRVTAANGKLGGFSGGQGSETKRILLAHEQQFRPQGLFSALDD